MGYVSLYYIPTYNLGIFCLRGSRLLTYPFVLVCHVLLLFLLHSVHNVVVPCSTVLPLRECLPCIIPPIVEPQTYPEHCITTGLCQLLSNYRSRMYVDSACCAWTSLMSLIPLCPPSLFTPTVVRTPADCHPPASPSPSHPPITTSTIITTINSTTTTCTTCTTHTTNTTTSTRQVRSWSRALPCSCVTSPRMQVGWGEVEVEEEGVEGVTGHQPEPGGAGRQ